MVESHRSLCCLNVMCYLGGSLLQIEVDEKFGSRLLWDQS
jgi:hypothetical protein